MSKFVNYNKRSIQLPPGCKDLADLLKTKILTADALANDPDYGGKMRRELISGTITNVPQQVSKVFHSEARYISLVIGEPRNHYTVCVSRFEKSEFSAYVTAESNPEREQAVRAVLGAYNLEVPPLSGPRAAFIPAFRFNSCIILPPFHPVPKRFQKS